ncbi:MAG: ferredoxin, partial [Sedimenticola sp.]|nr:ferredoxin [Sedimenticola sp.]
MELPVTFADFAFSEGRFRKHFRAVPQDAWNDDMIELHEFLQLDEDGRDGRFPFIWAVNKQDRLMRVLVAQEIVKSCEERQVFWHQIRSLAGEGETVNEEEIANRTKAEMAQKLTTSLLSLVNNGDISALTGTVPANGGGNGATALASPAAEAADYEPVWIETPECTACDECTDIAPGIFKYNEDKLAVVVDPKGGTYKDIVKAAEKCTAGCLHPGTPWNPNEKDLEKLVKRAAKYQ